MYVSMLCEGRAGRAGRGRQGREAERRLAALAALRAGGVRSAGRGAMRTLKI